MKHFPLSKGNYINLETMTDLIREGESESYNAFHGGDSTFLFPEEVAALRTALNAPVQIKTFVGQRLRQENAINDATSGANAFLKTLQPWQVINIATQMIYEPSSEEYDAEYSHIITITYRDLQAVKPNNSDDGPDWSESELEDLLGEEV